MIALPTSHAFLKKKSSGVTIFTPPYLTGLLMQIDVGRASSVWTDTARTAAASLTNTVKGVSDFSGNNNHWSQASAPSAPTLQVSPTNSKNVLRFADGGTVTMNFTSGLSTIRTIYWAINQSAGNKASWNCFMLGDSSAYNFHANDTGQGCFTPSYSNVNVLHIDKTNVAIYTARPLTLKVVTAQTSGNTSANRFSYDRSYQRSWEGDLALLLIYSTLHSAGEMSATEDAIKTYLSI